MTQLPTIDVPPPLSTARTRLNALYPLVRWTLQALFAVAFVIAVYEALVAGEIRIWPNAPDRWILPMWVLAATLSGLGLNSVRRLAANLLRAAWPSAAEDPYAALAAAVAGVRMTAPSEDALARLTEIAVAGTGARTATIRRATPDTVATDATMPVSGAGVGPAAALFPIRADGRVLGEFVLEPPPGRTLTKGDRQLAESLADAAGSVLRGMELAEQLAEQLRRQEVQAEELDRSRRRVVAARDDARELLGREIQGSVGETLAWCGGQAAELLAESEPAGDSKEAVDALVWEPRLVELTERVDAAIKDFRRIVHGLYPATLTDHGLTAALGNLAADLPGRTTFSAPQLPRFEPRFEAGVYFCLAALLAPFGAGDRHAARIEMELDDRAILVRISALPEDETDAAGWDPGALDAIRDRVAALDGELRFAEADAEPLVELVIPQGAIA